MYISGRRHVHFFIPYKALHTSIQTASSRHCTCHKAFHATFHIPVHSTFYKLPPKNAAADTTMALSLVVHAPFDVIRPRQPRQLPNEFELSILPSELHVVPMPFPAAHPSRATSPMSSSAASIASTNTTPAHSVLSYRTSDASTSTSSRPTSSASTDSISSLSTTPAQSVVFKPNPKVKSMDAGRKNTNLEVHNVFLPRAPVLRPLESPMLGLTNMIPELRLDLIVLTPMSLPETPVLRPWSDGDGLKAIPKLNLDL